MDARFSFQGNTVAAKFAKYINSAGAVVSNSTLPAATQELVKIRASQINSCAACTDMHTKDAAHAGESPLRLNLVAVWREANVFTVANGPVPEARPGVLTFAIYSSSAREPDDRRSIF